MGRKKNNFFTYHLDSMGDSGSLIKKVIVFGFLVWGIRQDLNRWSRENVGFLFPIEGKYISAETKTTSGNIIKG